MLASWNGYNLTTFMQKEVTGLDVAIRVEEYGKTRSA